MKQISNLCYLQNLDRSLTSFGVGCNDSDPQTAETVEGDLCGSVLAVPSVDDLSMEQLMSNVTLPDELSPSIFAFPRRTGPTSAESMTKFY